MAPPRPDAAPLDSDVVCDERGDGTDYNLLESMAMELELRFVPNAFKHGVTEDEIWDVFLDTTVQCVTVKYKTSHSETIYTAYGIGSNGRRLS